MEQLVLLTWLLTCLIGFTSIVIFFLLYLKYRKSIYLTYLLYLISFSFVIFLHTISIYIKTNLTPNSIHISFIATRYLQILGEHLLFYFLFITHFDLIKSKKKGIRLYWLLFLFIMFIIQNIMFFIVRNDTDIIRYNQASLLLYYAILLVLTTFLLILKTKKEINDNKIFYLAGYILFVIFLPFLVLDSLIGKYSFHWKFLPENLYFMLIFYFFWNIYSIIIGIKIILSEPKLYESIKITDEFIKKNQISEREKEIISLVINGNSNKEIADKLFISIGTVKTHLNNIFKKVNVSHRMALIDCVIRYNIE